MMLQQACRRATKKSNEMLERIRWWLASLFAYWALELMRPETAEEGFSIALTNAEKQAQRRERREQHSKALEQKVTEQQAEIERLRNQPVGQLRKQSEVHLDPRSLSMSARQKLEAAIQQQKRKLEAEFDQAVQAEVVKAIEETVLPQFNEEMADARQVLESRKGVMLRQEYLLITSCLRPDQSASNERLNEACTALNDPENTLSIQLLSREGAERCPESVPVLAFIRQGETPPKVRCRAAKLEVQLPIVRCAGLGDAKC
jgi:hypothetical protein